MRHRASLPCRAPPRTRFAKRLVNPPLRRDRLKIEDFKPEFAGKMNFYLNAVDELHRQPGDEPSIGLILCPGRNKTVTEWALRGLDSPVAVARYITGDMALTAQAPAEFQPALPDLPKLASELTQMVETAEVIYDDGGPDTSG